MAVRLLCILTKSMNHPEQANQAVDFLMECCLYFLHKPLHFFIYFLDWSVCIYPCHLVHAHTHAHIFVCELYFHVFCVHVCVRMARRTAYRPLGAWWPMQTSHRAPIVGLCSCGLVICRPVLMWPCHK